MTFPKGAVEAEAVALYETLRMGAGAEGRSWPAFAGLAKKTQRAWRGCARASLSRRADAVALAMIEMPALDDAAAKLGRRLIGGGA